MKVLLLFRHGKSDWDAPAEHDRDRPLKPRGARAARLMGRVLSLTGNAPDRVLASTAVRARRTAELAAAAGGWTCPVEMAPELYDASPAAALRLLQQTDERCTTVLLAGHEPTMSELVLRFTDGRVRFPTAAVARIDLPATPWNRQQLGGGVLAWLVTPRVLLRAGLEPPTRR